MEQMERQDEGRQVTWSGLAASVRGASKRRAGRINQDAYCWYPALELGAVHDRPRLFAAADGHGGARYFRSDRGAAFAVQVAADVIAEYAEQVFPTITASQIKALVEVDIPREIVRRWREQVTADHAAEPFSEDELNRAFQADGEEALTIAGNRPDVAYGATLICVLVSTAFIAYWQLGDGAVLTVSPRGEVSNPLPPDDRLLANQTTSLCGRQAECDFRTRYQHFDTIDYLPAMIMVATDGYPNSFREATGFEKAATDFVELLGTDGAASVAAQLPSWLEDTTENGSGDDITVGLLFRNASGAVDPAATVADAMPSPPPPEGAVADNVVEAEFHPVPSPNYMPSTEQ